jgi:hypothetical protein
MKSVLFFIALVTCCFISPVLQLRAQSTAGSQSFSLMSVPFSAQAIAMGGSAISMMGGEIANGLENPCLLDSADRRKTSLHYLRYLAQARGLQAMYVDRLDSNKIQYAIGIKSLGYGELTRYDATGTEQGSFRANDFLFQGVANKKLDSLLTIGIGYKVALSQYDNQKAGAMAWDAAVVYVIPKSRFLLTAVAKNLGFPIAKNTSNLQMSVPFDLQLGLSKQPKNAPFTYSLIYRSVQRWNVQDAFSSSSVTIDPITGEEVGKKKWNWGDQLMRHLVTGVDFKMGSALHFYLGYNYGKRVELKTNSPGLTGISWGTSVLLKRWQINYGGARWHNASTLHTIGIAFLPFSKL